MPALAVIVSSPLMGADVVVIPMPSPGSPQCVVQGGGADCYVASVDAEGGSTTISRITPAGDITPIATITDASTSAYATLVVDSDDNLWYPEQHAIDRITPAGVVTRFTAGLDQTRSSISAICYYSSAKNMQSGGIVNSQTLYFADEGTGSIGWFNSDGPILWDEQNESKPRFSCIASFDVCSAFADGGAINLGQSWGAVTPFTSDPAAGGTISSILQPNTGPDEICFTDPVSNMVNIVEKNNVGAAEAVRSIPVPTPESGPQGLGMGPAMSASDYYSIMFTERNAGKLGFLTPEGGIVEYALPTATGQPVSAVYTSAGTIVVAEAAANEIVLINSLGSASGSIGGSGTATASNGGTSGPTAIVQAGTPSGGGSSANGCGAGSGAIGLISLGLALASRRRQERRSVWLT